MATIWGEPMSVHKSFDRVCCIILAGVLVMTVLLISQGATGLEAAAQTIGYESRLFDTSTVHQIDIIMDNWEGFLETCENEEYTLCSIIIDGEAQRNVGLRAKGNTSLTQVAAYGNNRYSFKIEFDHYDSANTYHGLDKLSLNNIIQDNTYMKDYLVYQMMGAFGAASPLCSYAWITVNGEDWGLYLAVEGIEESFLQRNYGTVSGALYKPDSQSFGGGRGNRGGFDIAAWQAEREDTVEDTEDDALPSGNRTSPPNMQNPPSMFQGESPPNMQFPPIDENEDSTNGFYMQNHPDMQFPSDLDEFSNQMPRMGQGGGPGGMSSNDVSLIYTDDQFSSYQNIFENAKTDITDQDRSRLIASLKQLNEGTDIDQVVDVEQVIRYFVVHNFVCNFDSYTGTMIHNYYLYEADGQLTMLPWDYNLAFGGFMGSQDAEALVNYPIDTPVSGGDVTSRPMLAWIFATEEYTQMYHQYFSEFIESYFTSGSFAQLADNTRALIAPYVEKDPTKFCTYEEFETAARQVKQFCLLRAESIRSQLNGSIPSTASGQAQDSSALINASTVDIAAMGTMNMGGLQQQDNAGDTFAEMNQPPEMPLDENKNSFPSKDSLQAMKEGSPNRAAVLDASDSWWLLALCVLILSGSLCLARLYRKRA